MDNQSTVQPITQPTEPPKEAWTEPVLRVTPIAETAGTKTGLIADGEGYSS